MRGIERSEMAPWSSAHFRNIAPGCEASGASAATCWTFGAISLRSIPLHPSLLRNDTFPRKGGRERTQLTYFRTTPLDVLSDDHREWEAASPSAKPSPAPHRMIVIFVPSIRDLRSS